MRNTMTYTAEIIAVGTELLLGNVANTDAQTVSEALSGLGINVYYHTVVGDNPARLTSAVEIAKGRADIIITTGGLGPTLDDLTKETVAACFGKKLVPHQPTLDRISAYFRRVGSVPTRNNERQAWLPEGCQILENDWGTAPGCAFAAMGKHVIMLPGPPRECTAMLLHCAVPYLQALSDGILVSHQMRIFGIGESAMEDRLHDLMEKMSNPTVAPYAKEGECLVRVTAKAQSKEAAEALLKPVMDQISAELGDLVYGVDVQSLEQVVITMARERGMRLALAESCTGGLMSKRITDMPGVSDVYLGGVCTYANEAKTALLGVPESLITQTGAVSEEVALAMARGCREKFGADLAVGITGIAGPSGGSEDKPVGLVYIALEAPGVSRCEKFMLGTDRGRVRIGAANRAFDMLRRYLVAL